MSLILPNVIGCLPYAYVIPEGNVGLRSHRADQGRCRKWMMAEIDVTYMRFQSE